MLYYNFITPKIHCTKKGGLEAPSLCGLINKKMQLLNPTYIKMNVLYSIWASTYSHIL